MHAHAVQKQSLSKLTSQHRVNIALRQHKFSHRACVPFGLHSVWWHSQSFWGPETLSHDLTFAAGRQQSLLTQPQEVCCQGNRERSFKSYALILLLKTDLTGVFFFFLKYDVRALLPASLCYSLYRYDLCMHACDCCRGRCRADMKMVQVVLI